MPVISGGIIQPPDGIQVNIESPGAPGANAFAGQVRLGGLCVDNVNAKWYVCTATNGTTTSTWVVLGSQV